MASFAELLMRAAAPFVEEFFEIFPIMGRPHAAPKAAPAPAPGDIGTDPTTRQYVWFLIQRTMPGHFPGGRSQFEAACNEGWVRVRLEHGHCHLEIGPPPPGARPRSQPADAPRSPRRPTGAEAIAGAMKVLGYRKLDTPAPAEIKERYRDLARRHHPDLATTPAKRDKATDRMARINAAYDLLKAEDRA